MTLKHFIAFALAAVVATIAYFSGLVATENLVGSVITAAVILGLMGDADLSFGNKRLGMSMGIAVGITLGAVFAVSVSTTLDTLSKLA